ncbi:hypothetical protein CANARDRAFT_9976 [[Candida] arabinofermentans NRRL YB-2248]|uniref:Uncharacterized protein n=1 Tax=[Candida] arabinofermentans NRRL YB-2248 TaxID=983967 RepID=A0A1E4SU13_9ASCO|nr:hypothetical protein CANARDRAFT_9976 [[Candida] arabinofermentans NRRL YB-2248]
MAIPRYASLSHDGTTPSKNILLQGIENSRLSLVPSTSPMPMSLNPAIAVVVSNSFGITVLLKYIKTPHSGPTGDNLSLLSIPPLIETVILITKQTPLLWALLDHSIVIPLMIST